VTSISPATLLNITYFLTVTVVVLTVALVVVVAIYVGEVGDRRARRRRRSQPEVRHQATPTQEIPRYPHAPTYRSGAAAVGRPPGTDLVPADRRTVARQR
jgi:hypothetical protein